MGQPQSSDTTGQNLLYGGSQPSRTPSPLPSGTATGASIASVGLSSYADILKGEAVQSSDIFRAQQLENAAARGRVAAVQTGAAESMKIASDLGNVDAIRAAARTDPTSPTGAAVRDWHEQLGLTRKAIDVDQLMAQAAQEDVSAQYLRQAGKQALMMGYLNVGTDVASALAKAG